jgi:2-(1,2-epoxy-1,2-dihydrophenyl)acetyl-CoA isomerase
MRSLGYVIGVRSDSLSFMADVVLSEGRVATVTINRSERRNSLTVAATKAIADSLRTVASSSRVAIITGAGTAFCAGGDFDELKRFSAAQGEQSGEGLYTGFQQMIRTIREVEIPVIAAVNGPAMGAGMDLALACDLRVASTDAKLGQVWARLGIIPGTGGAFWTTLLAGAARASHLLLTGEVIDAKTALDWGLVNEVVDAPALMERANEMAETIAANPREGIAANKRALNEVIRPIYEAALEHAAEVQPKLFAGEEFRAALEKAASRGRT